MYCYRIGSMSKYFNISYFNAVRVANPLSLVIRINSQQFKASLLHWCTAGALGANVGQDGQGLPRLCYSLRGNSRCQIKSVSVTLPLGTSGCSGSLAGSPGIISMPAFLTGTSYINILEPPLRDFSVLLEYLP